MTYARLMLGLVMLGAATGAMAAERAVLFTDGRSMTVSEVERDDALAVLFLTGGGALSVERKSVG